MEFQSRRKWESAVTFNVDFSNHPLLFLDSELKEQTRSGRVSRDIIKELKKLDINIIECETAQDALNYLAFSPSVSGLVYDWDTLGETYENKNTHFLDRVLVCNAELPIFVLTQRHEIEDIEDKDLHNVQGFIWKYADTADFIAERIYHACRDYLLSLYPPFFAALVKYVQESKYAWHTPGHMGGVAFLKSPIGQLFYDFYGEPVFRSDLSISVPELGSLMEHSGVNGVAEQQAAATFGADLTYFVTNGTSTSNKVVVMGTVTQGDVAIVDRNCHKSLQHALTMANVIPIYFKPTRNAYGIIGGIPSKEFTDESIRQKIAACPLIQDKGIVPKLAVVTNSTYDGLVYNVNQIKDLLANAKIPVLHFDEAWFPYAKFNPIYAGKFAMSDYHHDYHPTVFATQSTHKLLAAFSQASMVHLKKGNYKIDPDLLNETFMMHTSTSPQYSIIASLDVATKMMSGHYGYRLTSESITEAVAFRQEFFKVRKNILASKNDWFFKLWQPYAVTKIKLTHDDHHYLQLTEKDAENWQLKPNDAWHGFGNVDKNFLYLDPIKVTILTPGINQQGQLEEFGIPAAIVSKYFMNKGVVDEKTAFYSLLFLFSIGVNKSKSMTLLSDLVTFKDAFDNNTPLELIFPDLIMSHKARYQNLTLPDLAAEMHQYLRQQDASQVLMEAFDVLPEQVITPNEAYQHIVRGNTEEVFLDDLTGRIILTMVAPYPPGIPVVMPGERLDTNTQVIINYLKLLEGFDNAFPGFENEVHGAEVKIVNGQRRYAINCIRK